MARASGRIIETEETAHYIVYDRKSGEILAVHHLCALPGVRAPSEQFVRRQVLACAAEALSLAAASLAVLDVPESFRPSPGWRVDVAKATLTSAPRATGKERTSSGEGRGASHVRPPLSDRP